LRSTGSATCPTRPRNRDHSGLLNDDCVVLERRDLRVLNRFRSHRHHQIYRHQFDDRPSRPPTTLVGWVAKAAGPGFSQGEPRRRPTTRAARIRLIATPQERSLAGNARCTVSHSSTRVPAVSAGDACRRSRPPNHRMRFIERHGQGLFRRPFDRDWGGRKDRCAKNSRAYQSQFTRHGSHFFLPLFWFFTRQTISRRRCGDKRHSARCPVTYPRAQAEVPPVSSVHLSQQVPLRRCPPPSTSRRALPRSRRPRSSP
jgi:hypothetical protein